ncbi:MAG: saccharopine dehydrogenase NADP-binding domain-containing protein [Thermoplasmata archaeon]|nr:saccharopine dehydrogenase NADP-binding domain-containing protein [Thermoplasmata archaeon]MCI4356154.1 saccharopine dehydrogenase NADP-binding domain-containing protein [Thermoplasmata archaeon]
MEAVVLGGGGLTGRCTVRDLAATGGFDAIRIADLDLGLAESAARATGSDRVRAEALDVRDAAALRRVLKGADVCVNAVQYTFNLAVMEGCLAEGVPYLDFGGLFHTTRRQLAQDSRFREAGLLAIPGLGQVPGISNVLAVEACRDLERVDSIVIRDGWRDLTPNGPEIVFTWSPSTFLDEMIQAAMVFENGAYRAYPPMSGGEEFAFPAPVGRTTVYRTLHSEPATIPESLREKGLRHCEWKEGGPGIDLLRTMAKLGLGSESPVEVRGQPVVPREFLLALLKREHLLGAPAGVTLLDWEVCDIEIHGQSNGAEVERHAQARFPPRPDWGFTATEYAVGVAGAIGARLIVEGAITQTGVVPPERCVPAGPLRAALAERGIETTVTPPEPPLPPPRTGAR